MRVLAISMMTLGSACSEYGVIDKDGDSAADVVVMDTASETAEPPASSTPSDDPPVDTGETTPADPPPADSSTGDDNEDPPTTPPEDTDMPPVEEEEPSVVEDPPEDGEELFCTEFADFDDWSYVGDGSWGVTDGILEEFRGGYYTSVAHTADDLGAADSFAIQVDASYAGSLNDLSGVVWGVGEPVWYAVRWDDPQGDYGRYTPTGAVEVAACDTEGCRILTVDSSADIYQPADGSWSTWRVSVRGVNVQVERNGVTVMNTAVPELARSGLGSVGVYSNDNDGGVFYDNFCAWRLE